MGYSKSANRRIWMIVLAFWLAGLGTNLAKAEPPAQTLKLVSDRPDFTESSSVVQVGHLQLEYGAEFSGGADCYELSLPLLLIRYGVAPALELRIEVPSIVSIWSDYGTNRIDIGSAELSLKYIFGIGDSAVIGFIPIISLPVKGDHYDSAGVSLGGKLAWAVDPISWLGVGGNLGVRLTGLGAPTQM